MESGKFFQQSDPREILVQIFQEKREKNPSFSLRAWSRQLGFRHPSYLSQVMRGKIRLQPKLAMKISRSLDISEEEKRYFEALVFYTNANTESEKEFFSATIKQFRPEKDLKEVESDYLIWIKSWVYWLMDEIIFLKDFRDDPAYLAKRIGHDVTPQMIALALKDMLEHGYVERGAKGRLVRPHVHYLPERDTLNKQKLYFEKVGKKFDERGEAARLMQPPNEVYFRSVARAIRRRDIPKIRERLNEFFLELREFDPRRGEADELFAFDIAFFKLTLGKPS